MVSAFTLSSAGVPVPVNQPSQDSEEEKRENVVALVSPFEGGEGYIIEAVSKIASRLDADIVRLDLALGVGFEGLTSPLKELGKLYS